MNKIEGVPFHGTLPSKHVAPHRSHLDAALGMAGSAAKAAAFGLAGRVAGKVISSALSGVAEPAALGAVGGLAGAVALGPTGRSTVRGALRSRGPGA